MLRPWLFRLCWRIQFFSGGALPPTTCVIVLARRVILARGGDVILRLRLHRRPSDAEVSRKLRDRRILRRRLQMVARFAILARQTKMRFAIEPERRVFAFAGREGCFRE